MFLLYGWLYDIYSYVDVVLLFVVVGYCVIVLYLCGYGLMMFCLVDMVCNG